MCDKTKLSDRMRMYEQMSPGGGIFMPQLPIICRMDGRNFSKWTKGLRRPFDGRLSRLMIETTKLLVAETGACFGYTQSDEITLVLMASEVNQELYYGSKISKIISQLSALTGDYFNGLLEDLIPEKKVRLSAHDSSCFYGQESRLDESFPSTCTCGVWKKWGSVSGKAIFDARAFNVPNVNEAINAVFWREIDATRNSVSMAARNYYSHKELHGKSRVDKMDLLMQKGINWNDYPAFFKRGTYCRRLLVEGEVRARVRELDLHPLRDYSHEARVEVLLGNS